MGEFCEQSSDGSVAQEFCRCWIIFEVVAKVGAEDCGEVFQVACARLEKVDGGEDLLAGTGRRESSLDPFFFDQRKLRLGRVGTNVLGVEPAEFVSVEDGVR